MIALFEWTFNVFCALVVANIVVINLAAILFLLDNFNDLVAKLLRVFIYLAT